MGRMVAMLCFFLLDMINEVHLLLYMDGKVERCYAANRRISAPLRLYFTGIDSVMATIMDQVHV